MRWLKECVGDAAWETRNTTGGDRTIGIHKAGFVPERVFCRGYADVDLEMANYVPLLRSRQE